MGRSSKIRYRRRRRHRKLLAIDAYLRAESLSFGRYPVPASVGYIPPPTREQMQALFEALDKHSLRTDIVYMNAADAEALGIDTSKLEVLLER